MIHSNMPGNESKPSVLIGLTGFVWIVLFLSGCWRSEPESPGAYLVRVGESVFTVADFNQAFELSKSAYPHNMLQNPAELNAIRSSLLSQITEEMILTEKAREINVEVTDTELEDAISEIKKDYPDGAFEETFMEYAVSYPAWKERLRIRLLKEKVVKKELLEHVTITADDIANYSAMHHSDGGTNGNSPEGPTDVNALIIERLRRQKAEEAYGPWIKSLQGLYPVEIDRSQWGKIIESQID